MLHKKPDTLDVRREHLIDIIRRHVGRDAGVIERDIQPLEPPDLNAQSFRTRFAKRWKHIDVVPMLVVLDYGNLDWGGGLPR